MSLIIVNRLPGSGKTTLADALIAFRSREEASVKWSQQLGLAAAACLWRLVSDARGNAVIESRALDRHWIHLESSGSTDADWNMWEKVAEPLFLGTVHRVDTTKPVNISSLIQEIEKKQSSTD